MQTAFVVILGMLMVVAAGWRFTSGLLVVVARGVWSTTLRSNKTDSRNVDLPMRTAVVPLPNRERLLRAIEDLQEVALNLIELRRRIYRMNTQHWYYDHKRETMTEIEATRRYRDTKRVLSMEQGISPRQFWTPVDKFCAAIERGLVEEVYSPPGDQAAHDRLSQCTQDVVRQIDVIEFRDGVV